MIDLHIHSTFSDGTLTPEELVDEAERLGLSAIALTDHDNTAGLPRFLTAAEGRFSRAITGVELSVTYDPGAMHMLGYFIRHDDAALEEKLVWIRSGRDARNRQILQNLQDLGLKMSWEEVASKAKEGVIGRPHFASVMVERGYVKDMREAFDAYLGRGKPAYARRSILSPEEAIRVIRDAGGVPVLAHPFSLGKEGKALRDELKNLRQKGLQGLEVYYPAHSQYLQDQLAQMAHDFNLVATGGSDFHGADKPDLQMGRGFGSLHVPDEVIDQLEQRRA